MADLDVLKLLDGDTSTGRSYELVSKTCDCQNENTAIRVAKYASVDTWNELLDLPESIINKVWELG